MDATGKIVLYVVLAIIVLGGIITFSVFSMSGGREYSDGEGAPPRSTEQAQAQEQNQEPSKSIFNSFGNYFKGPPKDNYGTRVGRKRSRSSKQRKHRKQ